jgi:hypothetical protein
MNLKRCSEALPLEPNWSLSMPRGDLLNQSVIIISTKYAHKIHIKLGHENINIKTPKIQSTTLFHIIRHIYIRALPMLRTGWSNGKALD